MSLKKLIVGGAGVKMCRKQLKSVGVSIQPVDVSNYRVLDEDDVQKLFRERILKFWLAEIFEGDNFWMLEDEEPFRLNCEGDLILKQECYDKLYQL